ncbi:MAG: 50S ribosomal protein L11 methyltransferase [Actinobacteria bacterium]|nr:50S ribosomal protein L11 methyltransferase [Actinomycetota bacterium]
MQSIEFVVSPDEAEFACGLLWSLGVSGVEERAEPDGAVRLIAGFEDDLAEEAQAELEQRWPTERGAMNYEQYLDSWRPFARAVRVGERLVIQPPWIDPIAQPGDLVISVDPGRAWGHGAHPTTVLCVEALLRLGDLEGRAVLDVGCGSGVLAIAAALLGAEVVQGIDIDLAAVEATLANALVSGADGVVEASTTPVAVIDATFDIVVANIGLATLVELAPAITGRVKPGGVAMLSGLLVEQVDAAVAAYGEFDEVERRAADGWSVVVLRKRG